MFSIEISNFKSLYRFVSSLVLTLVTDACGQMSFPITLYRCLVFSYHSLLRHTVDDLCRLVFVSMYLFLFVIPLCITFIVLTSISDFYCQYIGCIITTHQISVSLMCFDEFLYSSHHNIFAWLLLSLHMFLTFIVIILHALFRLIKLVSHWYVLARFSYWYVLSRRIIILFTTLIELLYLCMLSFWKTTLL